VSYRKTEHLRVVIANERKDRLALVAPIVATCPVIALLHGPDPAFVKEASRRGVFTYITDRDGEEWRAVDYEDSRLAA
jgi:response regulator NasT